MENSSQQPVPLTRYAWLSIIAAIMTITLKSTAYAITGSVGLQSDAIESLVNLAAATVALIALRIVTRPASDEFTFGYSKVEYFSSGLRAE
jgi:divalent metal cation (Fe/Co/Zn/Cd) transporter